MFPIRTDGQDFGDEDDGLMTSFDENQLPVDHEVHNKFDFCSTKQEKHDSENFILIFPLATT
jgi:hypothetical protein